MNLSLLNQQASHPLRLPKLQKLTDWLGRKLESATAPQRWGEVSIVLTDDQGITQPNREYFGKNRPTDVISFRYDPVPGEDEAWTGDLIINVDRAVQVGPDHKGIDYELALYIAHGLDHLSGAEDDTDEKRKAMRATETAWLRQAAKEGLMDGICS
ncbi:MAG: rRNA maturation RNase YbeY [Pontiella sp.]|nr:rRNA maturation RNase YbeY [Pontiella sp.]MBT8045816.1 rRNA maturation RNase YbeY [Pontiella sp.]NNJ70316.1 rRNA maturation RNase YbeY [Kiritimatiellales bacterium]